MARERPPTVNAYRRITMDLNPTDKVPRIGDVLETLTKRRAPTVYLVASVRLVKPRMPRSFLRFALSVEIVDESYKEFAFYRIKWHPRKRKS